MAPSILLHPIGLPYRLFLYVIVHSFPAIFDGSFWWRLRTCNLGEGGGKGSRMVAYRPKQCRCVMSRRLLLQIIPLSALIFWNFRLHGILIVGVANPQSWVRGGRGGRGWYTVRKSVGSSYRPSVVTFPLFLRVSEKLPLICSSLQHATSFLTPPLSPQNVPICSW